MSSIAIATWNMQGCNQGQKIQQAKRVFDENPSLEIMLLQETGQPSEFLESYNENSYEYSAELYLSNRFEKLFVHGKFWNKSRKAGNLRCSLAVLTTVDSHHVGTFEVAPTFDLYGIRGLIGITIPFGSPENSLFVGCIHAVANENTAPKHIEDLVDGMLTVNGQPSYWIIGGDFNCEPTNLKDKLPTRCKFCPPREYTHNARDPSKPQKKYDYFLHSKNLITADLAGLNGGVCGRFEDELLVSDHFAQAAMFEIVP